MHGLAELPARERCRGKIAPNTHGEERFVPRDIELHAQAAESKKQNRAPGATPVRGDTLTCGKRREQDQALPLIARRFTSAVRNSFTSVVRLAMSVTALLSSATIALACASA
jgi:hypothetical protein